MHPLEWLAWTWPTALFFLGIAAALIGMLAWELAPPTVQRRGFLPISTTRGDRFFIGLLGSAFIHLAWIGVTDQSVWFALAVSLLWMATVMRFG